jgi:prolycopene isomerase
MRDYDAVVVGAGLGGLSAAAFLTKAGKRLLLLERHNVPGGYASSFVRGRFEFEISLHELSGLGSAQNQGPLWRLFNQCGVAQRVQFLPIREFYRSVFPDLDITIPIGRQSFESVLCDAFPAEAQGIRRFSSIVFDFAEQALRANRLGIKAVMQNPSDFPTLVANFGKTLSQVLNPEVKDEKARAVLGQIWGYFCQPPSRMSFTIYALGVASYLKFGPAHIKGTSQALSQAFVDAIEEQGGEVWLGNGAKRILVEGGRVTGVVTDDGTRIACPHVVCNANPVTTCVDLIGPENVPDWYLRRLGAWSSGASTFNVYLGLDCTVDELGLNVHENFVNADYDLDGQYEVAKRGLGADPTGAAVTPYNVADPDFSPPGSSSVVLTLITLAEHWLKLSPSQYLEAKHAVARKVIRLAERVAPGLRDHTEVMEVATPLTNVRYTGNPGGSIIGFNETFQGTGLTRMPIRGPLEGLYFSSAWVNIGGGYEPSIQCGYQASRELLEDMERGGRDGAAMEKLKGQMEKEAGDSPGLKAEPWALERAAIRGRHPERLALTVQEVRDETRDTKTLRMVPAKGELPPFRAGQYVSLVVRINGVTTSRPYSIASPPGKPYYDLTVRRVAGGFVSHHLLDQVKAEDLLESSGPCGCFCHEPLVDSAHLVFLAGGSGITPFASMIREAQHRGSALRIHLIYGSRDPANIIFEKELREIAAKNADIRVDFVISETSKGWTGLTGLLDAPMISSLVGSVKDKTFFICGPAPMHALCETALKELGVPARRIRREAYGPPADITQEPGWPRVPADAMVEVLEERSGRGLRAKAGEPLMNALERAGIVVPALCRSGECTACRTRLISGKVFMPARVRRRWADERFGYIHPCMSYPLEDLRIRI